MGEIAKLLDGVQGDINVDISDTRIKLRIGEIVLESKLIEGAFPDYERVTPELSNTVASVDAKSLKSALDRVSIVSSDRGGKAVKFVLEDGKLELRVSNPDHGDSAEDMPAEWDAGDFDIGFNAKYCLDVINAVGADKINISLKDAGAPTRFYTDDDPSTLCVLMPMRV